MITHPSLNLPGIRHGFFTREDGHSQGIFSSLNCGLGSTDNRQHVVANRNHVADQLGVTHNNLVSAYQVHGTDVITVNRAWANDETRPKADGLVSNTPGMALGILTADCGPVLFADATAGVIGACHAGWKGALRGVTVTTLAAMENLGAARSRIVAVLGPSISHRAYEVGPEFPAPFLSACQANLKFFTPSAKSGHFMFDLPAFLTEQLASQALRAVANLGHCTYEDEQSFFSYRRSVHRQEPDYGRLISAIALEDK